MASPAADTQVQKFTLAGGSSDFAPASGALSGTVSAYPGPWYVETQKMDIQYVRVPHEQYWANTCTATLSGASTNHGNIQGTTLVAVVHASYDTTISYQNYNLSSAQQPQEFTVLAASGDANGVSYGNITASTLGPMGSIITSKPYIRRTPYLGTSSQPLISRNVTGATFGVTASGSNSSSYGVPADTFLTDYGWWKQYGGRVVVGNGTFRETSVVADSLYHIPGAYDTSKEFLTNIDSLIDQIGLKVTNENLFAWPVTNVNAFGLATGDEGFVEYDINRHA